MITVDNCCRRIAVDHVGIAYRSPGTTGVNHVQLEFPQVDIVGGKREEGKDGRRGREGRGKEGWKGNDEKGREGWAGKEEEEGKNVERSEWKDCLERMHYGTKPGHFETSKIHIPTSEGVSEVSERVNE